jgi:DNA mismatch endonuclease, patch repair protein
MDVFDKAKRSWIMARIRGADTKPELLVRSIVHRLGFRFRLHDKRLPGNPDMVLRRHHKVIFVHGCFWHGHKGCMRSSRPAANSSFWRKKLDGNVARDRKNMRLLHKAGWETLVVWQCQISNIERLTLRIERFMKKQGDGE